MSNINYTVSTGNVYEDIGLGDADGMKIKAEAVMILSKAIRDSGMTQAQAASMLGIDQPKISKILRGQFRSLSLDKILSYLTVLGKDVDITVSKKTENTAHISMHCSNC